MNEATSTGRSGGLGRASRRGFLGAGAGGAMAAVLAACSGGSKKSAAAAPASAGASSEFAFNELANAGGVMGWDGLAVIGGGQSNKLWIIDAKYHKIVTSIYHEGTYHPRTIPANYPNLRDSHSVVFTKDFKRMFSATEFTYAGSVIIEYDPITLREVTRVAAGKGTHHMSLSPDDKFLYAANQYGANVTVVDTKTMKHVTDIPVGAGPDYISQSMYWGGTPIETPYLFVTVDGAKTLCVFNWKTNKIIKQMPLPATAHGVNITPDGKQVWLAGLAFQEVWVIDNPSLKIVKKLPISGNPIHISISPDNKYAYVTTSTNLIFKVDTTTYQTLWQSQGTVIPAHTGLSPDGKELWTLNHGMDTTRYPYLLGGQPVEGVQIWETEKGKLIAEIPMEAMPHEIQFVPYSAFGTPSKGQDISNGGSTAKSSTAPAPSASASTGK